MHYLFKSLFYLRRLPIVINRRFLLEFMAIFFDLAGIFFCRGLKPTTVILETRKINKRRLVIVKQILRQQTNGIEWNPFAYLDLKSSQVNTKNKRTKYVVIFQFEWFHLLPGYFLQSTAALLGIGSSGFLFGKPQSRCRRGYINIYNNYVELIKLSVTFLCCDVCKWQSKRN